MTRQQIIPTACLAEYSRLTGRVHWSPGVDAGYQGRALGGAHVPPRKVFRQLTGSVNKTMLKPRLAVAANTYTSDFLHVKFRVAALKRCRRKQSSSGIRTIIRIGHKS